MHLDGSWISFFCVWLRMQIKFSPNQENSCDCNARNVFDIVLMLMHQQWQQFVILQWLVFSVFTVSFMASSSTLFWFELKAVFEPFTYNYSCGSNSSIRFGQSIRRKHNQFISLFVCEMVSTLSCSEQETHFHQIKTQNCLISCDKLLSVPLSGLWHINFILFHRSIKIYYWIEMYRERA